MDDAINATQVGRCLESSRLDLLAQITGQVDAVLDESPGHVDHVERAIGTVLQIHRPEAFVRGGQEFIGFVGVGRRDHPILFGQFVAANEVRARFAQENVTAEILGKLVAPVHQRAAGGREAGELSFGREGVGLVAAVHARIHTRGPNLLGLGQLRIDPGSRLQVRIPGQVMRRQQVAANLVGVGIVEQPTHIVVANAPLAPGHGFFPDPRGC